MYIVDFFHNLNLYITIVQNASKVMPTESITINMLIRQYLLILLFFMLYCSLLSIKISTF